ncbi:type I restriction-modification system restriction subunit [Tolypothrix sp. PCC 7601]|nr:type I restriction-modification system restriction subunit [Tolypothrix sp. PCC 7601]
MASLPTQQRRSPLTSLQTKSHSPDKQEKATVLQQFELLCRDWTV